MVLVDSMLVDQDVSISTDVNAMDSGGDSTVISTDASVADILLIADILASDSGLCSALPTTASSATRLLTIPEGSQPPTAIAFSPSGLLGVTGDGPNTSTTVVVRPDGFSRFFNTNPLLGGRDLRFITDNLILVKPTRYDTAFLYSDSPRGAMPEIAAGMNVRDFAVDGSGGIFYVGADGRLFRWTMGMLGPGDFLTVGVQRTAGMALNADGSVLFYASTDSAAPGIYRIALNRGMDGTLTATTPTLYFPANAIGTPLGVAVDVCGNVYTADERARLIWRIPPGTTSGTAGTRPTAVVTASAVGRPFFGSGGFDATRLYWMLPITNPNLGIYYAPVGVAGVRQ